MNKIYNFYLKLRFYFIIFFELQVNDIKEKTSLLFEDNFNEINYNIWKPHDYWGNGISFRGMYDQKLKLPENLTIHTENAITTKNNKLFLQNIKQNFDYENLTFPFQSGKLYHKEPFQFGYFEIKAIIPDTHSTWPAFWLTGVNRWPPEIDIFEFWTSNNPNDQVISLHYGEDNTKTYERVSTKLFINTPTKFNIYGCDWHEEGIDFYTNNILVYSFRPGKEIMKQYFHEPMYLILNNKVNNSDDHDMYNAKYPNNFVVDYIKVFNNIYNKK